MSMNLSDLVGALKRSVSVPGDFEANFPNSTDDDLIGLLADGVAEAQLDGFLRSVVLDPTASTVTPDLTTPEQALVILYAMARILVARIANLRNRTRYKANGLEAEFEQSATVLTELLKDIKARKDQLLADAKTGAAGTAFAMVDQYVARAVSNHCPELGREVGLIPDVAYEYTGWF